MCKMKEGSKRAYIYIYIYIIAGGVNIALDPTLITQTNWTQNVRV